MMEMQMTDGMVDGRSVAELEAEGAVMGFQGGYRFLSNFWPAAVSMYGISFPTVEHAFAAAKIDPKDPRWAGRDAYAAMRGIAALPSPADARRAGRKVTMRPDWDTVKFALVEELVRRKFAEPALRARLAATGERPLVEINTWGDRIWGAVAENGRLAGQNRLGRILMRIRKEA